MDEVTRYGFTFGPAEVLRVYSDKKQGVLIIVAGKRQEVEIRVTNSGLIRVFDVQKARKRT